jgi:hypothetical protein
MHECTGSFPQDVIQQSTPVFFEFIEGNLNLPSPSLMLGSAPCCINKIDICRWPCRTAQCSGVDLNSPPIASTSADLDKYNLAISSRLFIDAQWSGLTFSASRAFTSKPSSSKSCRTLSNAPYWVALTTSKVDASDLFLLGSSFGLA